MAESSSQNPSSPKITPKEELVTLDKPESPKPFLPTIQVEFTFKEIFFTTNNEVSLLYPSHPNQKYFKDVSNCIYKCCLKEAFTRTPTRYKEHLSEFWYTTKTLAESKVWVSNPIGGIIGEIGVITFQNSLRAQYLPHLKLTINPTQVFSIHNLTLKLNHPEEPPFTNHMKAIYNLNVHVDSKAPKPSSQTEEETKSSLAKDKSPSHPSPPTSVVGDMHKEAQQAAGGLTSLGATSEEGAHPQLSSDKTKSARDGIKTIHTNSGANDKSRADDISLKVNLEDLSETLKDIRTTFFTPDSLLDEPIIILDESEEEEEVAKDKDTESTSYDVPNDTSYPPPPSLKSAQIQELMAQVHLLQS
nr:hypothetical protein [Tanacetum cinerariifolium]